VKQGGRDDAWTGAINVYAHLWNTDTMRLESTLMGSCYAFWGEQNRIWQIEDFRDGRERAFGELCQKHSPAFRARC
jgi:hypothetical protein